MTTSSMLRMQHVSLQFSDPTPQQRSDAFKIFSEGASFPIKTGTEAGVDKSGGNMNRELIEMYADEFNHITNFAGDVWVAVDREIIRRGSVEKDDIFVVSNDELEGTTGHDRVLPVIGFDHVNKGIGRVNVGACHYPTGGRRPGDPNHDVNVKMANRIAAWMKKVATGKDLAFMNGDFNMGDNLLDWALGGNFTSMGDELDKHPNTGHGSIDGFCSYDRDARVSAHRFKVLDDKEFPLFTDHFLCRGIWEIQNLNS